MDHDASNLGNKVLRLGSFPSDGIGKHHHQTPVRSAADQLHRRHASSVSTHAAARVRSHALTSQHRDNRATSPHSGASAPTYKAQTPRPNAHMRKISLLSRNFSSSSLPPPIDTEDRPSSSPGARPPSTPLLRANTTPSLPRLLPSQKRKPPASHSSYGIETSNGPPPSYSTQQTLSQDRGWTQERGKPQSSAPPNTSASHDIGSYEAHAPPNNLPDTQYPDWSPPHVTVRSRTRGSNAGASTHSTPVSYHFPNHSDSLETISLATRLQSSVSTTYPEPAATAAAKR